MKKLITTSIVLLCLGSISFAQTAKNSVTAPPRYKGANTEKNKSAAAKPQSLKALLTSTNKNSEPVAQPEVSLPATKQN